MTMKVAAKRTILLCGVCLFGLAGCADYSYQSPAYSAFSQAPRLGRLLGFNRPAPTYVSFAQAPQPDGMVRSTQLALLRLGYMHDMADGFYGPQTRAAIENFQMASGLPVDGTPTWLLLSQLNERSAVVAGTDSVAAPVSDTPTLSPAAATAPIDSNQQWAPPPKAETYTPSAAILAPAKTASGWVAPATRP